MLQLTPELVISLVSSAGVGAAMAWLGNRIMQAELWGHVKKHCTEIQHVTERVKSVEGRQVKHGERLAVIEYQHQIDAREHRERHE